MNADRSQRRQRLRLAGAVVLMSFLFGNNFVALDVALRDAGPITLQAIAVTIAAVAVWVLTVAEDMPLRTIGRDGLVAMASIAAALSLASPVLMVYGVQRVNPAVAAMIVTTAPISTLVLERIVFKRRMDAVRVIGLAIGLVGVALVVVPVGSEGRSELIGVAVLVGASFAWAVGLILTRRLPGVVGGGKFVVGQMVLALPALYGLAFAIEGLRIDWTLSFVAAVGYSGAFAKGLASFLQFRAVRVGSPLQSSLAAFMVPAVATISTYLILGETVLAIQLLGMALIAVAVGVVFRAHRDVSSSVYDVPGAAG